jgi:DNA-directed RNA polymerase subunit E'/Rpb7
MNYSTIRRKISIPSVSLNRHLRENILLELREMYTGKCTKAHGYFIDVISLERIVGNVITTATCSNIFDVIFKCKTLLPKIGMKLPCEVCMVMEDGIFVEYDSFLNVLIPKRNLLQSKYAYDIDIDSYTRGDEVINRGSEIIVEIVDLKYDDCKFDCIGTS